MFYIQLEASFINLECFSFAIIHMSLIICKYDFLQLKNINMRPCGNKGTEVRIRQKIRKEALTEKMKRCQDERHTQTNGSLIETF